MYGLYIHIPYCVKKCAYCDFTSYTDRIAGADAYIDALINELSEFPYTYDTVFIGGGTPSLLSGEQMKRLLFAADIAPGAEVTAESNPGTLDEKKLESYLLAGVNRLSIGVQSLNNDLLALLGRIHNSDGARESLKMAAEAGFREINADMMTGIPMQTKDDAASTARGLIGAGATHISCYSLQIEEGTPLSKMRLRFPDEEYERELFYAAQEEIEGAGFVRYETSNFAAPGHECRHNLKYWTGEPYIGIGVAAHSFAGGQRWSNTCDYDAYLCGEKGRVYEKITDRDEMFEYIMLRLRLASGISFADYFARFAGDFAAAFHDGIAKCEKAGLITLDGRGIYPTDKGFDLQNALIGEFVNKI